MYYLSKMCRICIKTDVKLMDIDTVDFDSVRLSEKLEVCTKMAISRESVSTDICEQCVAKLRISYHFQDMCRKSTKILQGYLDQLTGDDKIYGKNTELNVIVTPVTDSIFTQNTAPQTYSHRRKQRITKEQRCSLLKRLLMPPQKKEERIPYSRENHYHYNGGLKSIIDFTRNYDFEFNLDKNSNIESTPLDKLKKFSNEFFRKDFSEFKNTILYIIENRDNYSEEGLDSEDEWLLDDESIPDSQLPVIKKEKQESDEETKFEEVVIEPDIKIKNETMDFEEDCDYAGNFVEATYGSTCKPEPEDDSQSKEYSDSNSSYQFSNHSTLRPPFNYLPGQGCASMQLLNRLVASYPDCRKNFSHNNVRCRTRNNPYINPTLKEQFLLRSFRCDKCSRYFKSPGYLKAHASKVHHC